MPASEIQDVRRGKLLQGLFWGGVGLASLAILILLFGQGIGALRVAVIVSVLTIVMLAVSVVLRPSMELVRIDIEERVLNEVDRVRARAREDVTTAARNTHRALSDKIHMLAETVEVLRAQMDEFQASSTLSQPAPSASHHGSQPGGPGVVRRTETVHVTRRTTTVDAGDDDARGTVYGSRAAVEGEWQERHDDRRPDDRRGERAERSDRGDDRWAAARADDHGRELRVGERRSSVRRDDRGSELHVEDRWVALRRDDPRDRRRDDGYGESDWEETFRSLSSKQNAVPALPPARGESPSRYLDERDDHDRERVRFRERDGDHHTSHARDRDRGRDHERDRPYDRYRDDDRDRYRDDDRDRHRDDDRDRYRDDDRDRYRDDDRDRGSDRDDRPYAPRPRSAHRSEYDH